MNGTCTHTDKDDIYAHMKMTLVHTNTQMELVHTLAHGGTCAHTDTWRPQD